VPVASRLLSDLIRQSDDLSPEDRRQLLGHLLRHLEGNGPRRKWLDMLGTAPCPMLGEDAQAWVSRTRSEGDEHRKEQWGKGS